MGLGKFKVANRQTMINRLGQTLFVNAIEWQELTILSVEFIGGKEVNLNWYYPNIRLLSKSDNSLMFAEWKQAVIDLEEFSFSGHIGLRLLCGYSVKGETLYGSAVRANSVEGEFDLVLDSILSRKRYLFTG